MKKLLLLLLLSLGFVGSAYTTVCESDGTDDIYSKDNKIALKKLVSEIYPETTDIWFKAHDWE